MCYIIQTSLNYQFSSIDEVLDEMVMMMIIFLFCSHVYLHGLVLSDSTGVCPAEINWRTSSFTISIYVMFSCANIPI